MKMIILNHHECGGVNKFFLSPKPQTCQMSLKCLPTPPSCFAEIGFNSAVFSQS